MKPIFFQFSENLNSLFRNKCDLTRERKVARQDAIQLAQKYNMVYIECSSQSGASIENIFKIIAFKVLLKEHATSYNPSHKKKTAACNLQ
jgi:hypothetical protein